MNKLITKLWPKLNRYLNKVYLDTGSPYLAVSFYMLFNYLFFWTWEVYVYGHFIGIFFYQHIFCIFLSLILLAKKY